MKISPKQATLLAREIFNQLVAANVNVVSPALIAKIEAHREQRERLLDVVVKAEKAVDAHEEKLKSIVGSKYINKIRNHWDADTIVKELEKLNTPSVAEIEDKILLKSMFANEQDMNEFVKSIIKEFTKKKVPVISNN